MSERDYAKEYEQWCEAMEAANSPLIRPMGEWSKVEAREIAKLTFASAPEDHARARLISEARDQIRAAKTPRRLQNIREKRPDLAEVIEEELDWLAYHTLNWDSLPFEVQVKDWIDISAMPSKDRGIKSTRGTSATWPGVREAAFVLIDWHEATEGSPPSIGWLANELARIEPDLEKQSKRGSEKGAVDRAKKLARQMLNEHGA